MTRSKFYLGIVDPLVFPMSSYCMFMCFSYFLFYEILCVITLTKP